MALSIRRIDDRIAVAPQIEEADIAEIARQGFKVLINNRPDGEEPGILPVARAAEVARLNGLTYLHIPVTSETLGPEAVEAFSRALQESPGPVLAHCRSGTRSCVLWSLAEARGGETPVAEILRKADAAGYDLSQQRPLLERYAV